jgi:glycosyltransferase involved in cell wall biosynthesis
MKFSAIIATIGRMEPLARLLHSLKSQDLEEWEAIIVDQNDDDRVFQILSRMGTLRERTRVEKSSCRNLSAARNHGIECSQGEFLFFPDDDSHIPSNFFSRTLGAFRLKNNLDFLSVPVIDEEGSYGTSESFIPISPYNVRSLTTASNLLFRRRVVERTGPFDPSLGLGGEFGSSEDTDYVHRVMREGHRGSQYQGTWVVHKNPLVAYDHERAKRAYHYNRGFGAFTRKHLHQYGSLLLLCSFTWEVIRNGLSTLLFLPIQRERSRYNLMSLKGKFSGFFSYPVSKKTGGKN